MRKITLYGILILSLFWLAGSTLSSTPLPAQAANSQQWLFAIQISSQADLERFNALDIPVLGSTYTQDDAYLLFAHLDSSAQKQLARMDLSFQFLEESHPQALYILVSTPSPERVSQAAQIAPTLWQDEHQALLRATPGQVDKLSQMGFRLRQIELTTPVPQSLSFPLPANLNHQTAVIAPSGLVQSFIDQVQSYRLHTLVGDLSGEWQVQIGESLTTIPTRFSRTTTPIASAVQYTVERFEALDLDVSTHSYTLPGTGTRQNVIAEQPGLWDPEQIFIISAHLDSTSEDPYKSAPGADDNASGSAGVLAIAEILSQVQFGCTIRYALFTGEEQGLVGSSYYAQDIYLTGEEIQGVLNLDMIAYNGGGLPTLELHTRPGDPDDLAIADLFAQIVDTYQLDLLPLILQSGEQYSDHASFWDYGYPAILAIEDGSDFTPYYHTTQDKLSTLNMVYFTDFVKAALGTLMHSSCLPAEIAGMVTQLPEGEPAAGVQITALSQSGETWQTLSMADGSYQLFLPGGIYTLSASARGVAPAVIPDISAVAGEILLMDFSLIRTPSLEIFLPLVGK